MSDQAGEELLTVAEAAARLGITTRRLRRLLERGEYGARTGRATRRTRTGTRTATTLSPDLIADIAAFIENESNQANEAQSNEAKKGRYEAEQGEQEQSEQGGDLVPLYQKILAERERLLSEKDARIAELTAGLEHERETTRRLAEALAREQTLRAHALPAPASVTDAPAEAPLTASEPLGEQSVGDEVEGGSEGHAEARRAWWQVWRR